MKTRIVYLTFFLLISLTWLLQAQYVLYKVPLPSGYAAEVRGYPGSTADGQTVTGSYNATDQLFHFQITISGPYRLYYNSGGGSPTTLDALWSGSYGRYLLGYDDMDLAIRLAGNSSGGQLLTAGLATGSVTSDKLGTASVTSSKLGTGSVTSTAVLDGSLTYQDMADLTINNAKLGPNSIDSTKVQPRQIDSSELEDGAVTNRTIASGAVNSASIENESIAGTDIADDAIDTRHVATGAIGPNEISSISNADIPSGTVAVAVNGLQDSVRIVAGSNVTVTTDGDSIEIAATGGGGDITAVNASSGLSGGGTSGDIDIYVGTAAITTSMVAPSAIDSTKISANSVKPSELSSGTAVRNLNDLTDNVVIKAGQNIVITSDGGDTLTISAVLSNVVQNSLIHEYRWNSSDARTDSLHDLVGTFDMVGVGDVWSGGTEPHLSRAWTYSNQGITYAVNRWISSTRESEMDLDSNWTIEVGLMFNSKYTSQSTFETIFSKGIVGTSSINYHLYRANGDGKLVFHHYNAGSVFIKDTTAVLQKGQWYQLAITATADSIYFYRDGAFTYKQALSKAILTNNSAFIMGGDHNGGRGTSFYGQMLYMRMYSRVLSESEINQNYVAEYPNFNTSKYFQQYTELDAAYDVANIIYPDSATTGNPVLYAALYNGDIDIWRVYYYRKSNRTLRMVTSTDSLQTLGSSTLVDDSVAVPSIYYDSSGDTLWLYAQDWRNLGAGDTTIYAYSSTDTGATWSSKQVAYSGAPQTVSQPILDPYVLKSGSTYYLFFAHANRIYYCTSTKPGEGYSSPQLTDLTAESGFDASIMEGPTVAYNSNSGLWEMYYSVLGARRFARLATNTSLASSGWQRQNYGLRILNGYDRKMAWASTLLRPVLMFSNATYNSQYNYYVLSIADGSSVSSGVEQFYRMMLLKRKANSNSQFFIGNNN
ncbi:MAG: hypothetical protein KDE64_09450 [Rhodocyclaceae bacterium]|nr:hypothetical protein [Rhodocyclaceae bacterium]